MVFHVHQSLAMFFSCAQEEIGCICDLEVQSVLVEVYMTYCLAYPIHRRTNEVLTGFG